MRGQAIVSSSVINSRTDIDASAIYAIRQSGASLQQIADRIGRTKERVRQILVKDYGSTKHKLISTQQLCKLLGLPRNRIIELYLDGVIVPAIEWTTGNHHYLLWSPATAEHLISYYKTHRLCKICLYPIPIHSRVYCSEKCYKEGQKYRYKSIEAKQRRLRSIKKCMARRRQLAQTAARHKSQYQPELSVVGGGAMQNQASPTAIC